MFLASALIAALLQAAPSGSVDPESEPFQTLETRVWGAIQAKNVQALDQLLAKDFAFMAFLEGRAPLVLNRGEWLKTSEHYALTGFEIRHLAARASATWRSSACSPAARPWRGPASTAAASSPSSTSGPRRAMPGSSAPRHLSRPDVLKR